MKCIKESCHQSIISGSVTGGKGAYYEAPTTNFRLFWDADSWNFSNNMTDNAFRTIWLLPVFAHLFKVILVKNQRFYSVPNLQLVSNDFQLLKALSC